MRPRRLPSGHRWTLRYHGDGQLLGQRRSDRQLRRMRPSGGIGEHPRIRSRVRPLSRRPE
ncbi:MAG: hypothetical protein K0V04_21620 [Deltaproteobacteria bacterium]|nr:hypothetical protein [Deltaproteobacteria bacterium]